MDKETDLERALMKKALGFDTEEVVEEYQDSDGEPRLIKRKVTKKNVPPDISAIKMILDSETRVSDMTDEELEKEKQRLLKLLEEKEK